MRRKVFLLISLVAATNCAFGAEGSSGRGGGNTLNGHPIEYYAKDISALPVYKTKIAPLLETIKKKVPQLGEDLEKVATDKIWYFVPVHLPQLSSHLTGIPFSSDQDILQSSDAVWIDSSRFPTSAEDQATLIRHELLMGMYMADVTYHNPLVGINYDAIRKLTIKLPTIAVQQDAYTLVNTVAAADSALKFAPAITDFYPSMSLSDLGKRILSRDNSISMDMILYNDCGYDSSLDPTSGRLTVAITTQDNCGRDYTTCQPSTSTMAFDQAPIRNQADPYSVSYVLTENKLDQVDQVRGTMKINFDLSMYGYGTDAVAVLGRSYQFDWQVCESTSGSACKWREMSQEEANKHGIAHNSLVCSASRSHDVIFP